MLEIDERIFKENLKITQTFCDLQMENALEKDALTLRTIQLVTQKPSFNFKKVYQPIFDFERLDNLDFMTVKWNVEPLEMYPLYFEQQMKCKRDFLCSMKNKESLKGKILTSYVYYSVTDGASEDESKGIIDIYDLPPIDTWFYTTKTKKSEVLFSWIPEHFVPLTHKGILVNCVDCFGWFEDCFPNEYNILMS
jgi:hypothetical protein